LRCVCIASIIVFGYALSACAQDTIASSAPSCHYGDWGQPREIESTRRIGFSTRLPIISSYPTAIVGTRVPFAFVVVGVSGFDALTMRLPIAPTIQWPPELRAILRDDSSPHVLRKGRWYAYPRSAIDGEGTLHVVWAEPSEALPRERRPYRLPGLALRTLWYARLRQGKWTTPQLIFRSSNGMNWDDLSSSLLVSDQLGRLHVAFGNEDSGGWSLVHLSSNPGGSRWNSVQWHLAAPAAYVDLASAGANKVAIAYVAGVPGESARSNVLFLLESADAGKTWSSPRPISQSHNEPAIEPHVFLSAHGLDLLWTSQPAESFQEATLWHTTRSNSEQLGPVTSLRLGSAVTNGSRATLDQGRTLHIVLREFTKAGNRILYTRLGADGRWEQAVRPFASDADQPFILAAQDTIYLTYSETHGQQDSPALSARLVYSRLLLRQ